jgi:RNA-dependent RNA polymerase
MLLSGLEPSQEPFLQKVISEMVKSDLKNYSSGKVPVPDAAYLMGCADPTGLLERNQVAILV